MIINGYFKIKIFCLCSLFPSWWGLLTRSNFTSIFSLVYLGFLFLLVANEGLTVVYLPSSILWTFSLQLYFIYDFI